MKKTFKIERILSDTGILFHCSNTRDLKLERTTEEDLRYHLYIISDEEIKEGDWITDKYRVWQWKDDSSLLGRKKIVATTDKSLTFDTGKISSSITCGDIPIYKFLPQLPESFIQAYIKAYNEGKPITEVDLEMTTIPNKEWTGNGDSTILGYTIKTRPDNTAIVHQSKMYSRDEVISLLNRCWYDSAALGGDDDDCISIDEWISQNL